MSIDSFKSFTGRSDRSRHFSWSPGEVEMEMRADEKEIKSGESRPVDPRRGHMAWGIQDVAFRRRIDESYDVDAHSVEPISQEELDHHAEHRASYDDQMKRSHAFYKMSSYHFNDSLRNQDNHSPEGHIRVKDYRSFSNRRSVGLVDEKRGHKIDHYDALDRITGKPTKTDMHVYRGFSDFPVHEMKPGTEFTDHGYTGTSRNVRTATSFSHLTSGSKPMEHIARIHVPAGTKAHYLDHPTAEQPSGSMHSRENEILLHRGTRFRVMGHSEIDRETARNFVGGHSDLALPMRIVHLKVVGQDPKPLKRAEERG